MSSEKRKLNFTNRRRIRREHVDITIQQTAESDPPRISATLDLAEYSLPSDADVFVEAYRHSTWQRFVYGTAGAVQAPEDTILHDFGAAEGVQFRVKVVEPASRGVTAARILAQADGIKPNQDGPRHSLLPLDPDPSLRDEVWRLDIDENDGPLVKVSTNLVRDRNALARSPAFLALALPEALRRILEWAVADGLPGDDEWDTPRGRWIRFTCGLLGQSEPPQHLDDRNEGEDARAQWIDDAIIQFCRANKIGSAFNTWWSKDATREKETAS